MPQIVRATYSNEDVFKVPSNVDLENKEQVEKWWIRYNILSIQLTNGKVLIIESEGYEMNNKTPDIVDIEEACDDEEETPYMNEDMGECPKCDCPVKRKDLAWRYGYYLDICAKCDDEVLNCCCRCGCFVPENLDCGYCNLCSDAVRKELEESECEATQKKIVVKRCNINKK